MYQIRYIKMDVKEKQQKSNKKSISGSNIKGDVVVKKQKRKVSRGREPYNDLSADNGIAPAKRRKQHMSDDKSAPDGAEKSFNKKKMKSSMKGPFKKTTSLFKKPGYKSKIPGSKVVKKKSVDVAHVDKTGAAASKPNAKELNKKERKQAHKSLKSNYELIHKSKKIWEEMRRVNVTPERRYELCSELLCMVQGKIKEFCFAHDTARVVQCLIQHGTAAQRDIVFKELKDEITAMVKSKYAKFLVKKIMKYGTKEHRSCVYQSLNGQVRKLIRHRIAADVLEYAYNEFANAQQRLSLLEDFYGPSFTVFKTPDIKCLSEIMVQPDKREMILHNMKEALLPLIDKNILVHSMVHKVFLEYFTYADSKMKHEMIEALRESIIHVLHTRDGSRVAMQVVWHGTAKDRKCIIKSLKGNVVKICKEEFGHMVMLAIFDCVDDTKIVNVILLDEMLKKLDEVAQDQYGRKVLLYLLCPRDPHHFHPDIVRVLQEGDQSLTSKKAKAVRYKELLEHVSAPLLQYIVEHISSLVVNNNMLLLLLAIITNAKGDPSAAMETFARVAALPFHAGNTKGGLHILENPAGHMTIKRLIQNDKLRMSSGETVLFSEVLLQNLPEGTLKSWASCNRGCFTILFLIDLGHPEVTKKVIEQLKGVKLALKKMTFTGAQHLLQKLEEVKT